MRNSYYRILIRLYTIFILLFLPVSTLSACDSHFISFSIVKADTKLPGNQVQNDTNTQNGTSTQSAHNTHNNTNNVKDNEHVQKQTNEKIDNNLSIKSYPVNTNKGSTNSLPILVYHHILSDEENPFGENAFIVSTENFRRQMQLLKDNNYNTITLEQLYAYIKEELVIPEKSILITFDDGYKSNYLYAYPTMKELSLKGVIFAVTGWIQSNQEDFNPHSFQMMNWLEIENSSDVFEYACHTHNLHSLDNNISSLVVSPENVIKADLNKSRQLLNNTSSIAYPYGQFNENIINIVKEIGFTMGFTTQQGNVKPGDNIYQLKRQMIFRSTTFEQFKKIIGVK